MKKRRGGEGGYEEGREGGDSLRGLWRKRGRGSEVN